jgi:hypothetical protein
MALACSLQKLSRSVKARWQNSCARRLVLILEGWERIQEPGARI